MIAVRLRLGLVDDLQVMAEVDADNNWTVDPDTVPPEVLAAYPELPDDQARVLTLLAESRGPELGYLPDPPNRWAYAALELYPGSEITGGLYALRRTRGGGRGPRPVVY